MQSTNWHAPSDRTLKIIPGRGWIRFTYAREDVELLGVVQRGLQIGAFARLLSGRYAQINGDVVQSLNPARVKLAMRQAGISEHVEAAMRTANPGPPPKITIKKRRRVAPL